ncbi:MAG: tRNA pseudouridine(55) synthase TruB [Micavibrio aeruginosavorus]|uniref:tRNA pseudouridine synthase B n=1 Tax=Micavibrio aeruginosavorus TaxID=349221 RepID=A0A7T5UG55_9BACT|nr:MAG: tRNA pseudouridine(55) synthase TruB [Micavibrio aeruginosavorus]
MGRSKKGRIVNGWINLDKPQGLGSTQAVGKVRRLFDAQKVGHGGTLDPLATGVLPIALGEATKTIPYCQDHIKIYTFSACWGEERDTDDAEGSIIATSPVRPSRAQIEAILPRFTGEISQIPPRFSAIKVEGERAYDLARDGEEVILDPRPVYIESLELTDFTDKNPYFRAVCGKGTYMRSLVRDMAKALGTVGHIRNLRREAVGPLTQKNAISLEKLEELADSARLEEALLPVETVLADIPALALNAQEAARLKNGQPLTFVARPDLERLNKAGIDWQAGDTALAVLHGTPVALVAVEGPHIHPVRVLNLWN